MDWQLRKHPDFPPPRGPLVIVIMDGVGVGRADAGDAVFAAATPTLDRLKKSAPFRTLRAHGTAVGLPSDEDMGNSEVGHNALGCGRVYDQGAKLVNRAIESGEIFRGATWRKLTDRCLERRTPLHLIGLLSDGNVHSHEDHLFALIREAHRIGIKEVYVHALLDGRDVPETSALVYVDRLEALLREFDGTEGRRYRIASGGGRMVTTMDRYEADWRIVERGWKAHVLGQARGFSSAREAIETYRREQPGVTDQFLPPFVIVEKGEPVGPIRDGSSVVFFNFRGDRAIEISRAFEEENFDKFDRGPRPDCEYAGMMQYDGDLLIPKQYLVSPPLIERTMGEYLARNGIPQLAVSETQKFGHVTYFWNGNRGGMFDPKTERYIEIPSDRVPFETRPEMKAAEITRATIDALAEGKYRLARLNYANGDMVGHTGVFRAAVAAVEAVDRALRDLLVAVAEMGGIALVTADHGNADEMYERNSDGSIKLARDSGKPVPRTSHSLNPVPFYVVHPRGQDRVRLNPNLPDAGIANVTATALNLLGFYAPPDYAPSLLL